MTVQPEQTVGDVVHLELDATTDHLRLVRLLVVGLASRHGANVDDMDDVRIAADEICAHLIEQTGSGSRLTIDVHAERDSGNQEAPVRIRLEAGCVDLDHIDPFDELRELVIDTTSDTHGIIDARGGEPPRVWFERVLLATPLASPA